MLRFEIREDGQPSLPPIDLDDAIVVIGSDPGARVRLPAAVAKPEHVRIEGGRWRGFDGAARGEGAIGDGVELAIGGYRVRVAPAPVGVAPTPPQRTESLARELVRNLLGEGGAPTLEIERGPVIGARRALAPPESSLVIGRGDEATWVIFDGDLSRAHVEVRRGWDGVRVLDRGSKNGTKVDGVRATEAALRDGALLELGRIAIRFRDPAARADAFVTTDRAADPALATTDVSAPVPRVAPAAPAPTSPHSTSTPVAFYFVVAIAVLAIAGLVWVLAS